MAAKTNTKKTGPSAAEKARREAQSAEDKGEMRPVDVDLWGVTVPVDPAIFTDLEVMADILTMEASDVTEAEQVAAAVRTVRRLCGDKWSAVMRGLRAANDGKAPLTAIQEIMERATEAVGSPESSAS